MMVKPTRGEALALGFTSFTMLAAVLLATVGGIAQMYGVAATCAVLSVAPQWLASGAARCAGALGRWGSKARAR